MMMLERGGLLLQGAGLRAYSTLRARPRRFELNFRRFFHFDYFATRLPLHRRWRDQPTQHSTISPILPAADKYPDDVSHAPSQPATAAVYRRR